MLETVLSQIIASPEQYSTIEVVLQNIPQLAVALGSITRNSALHRQARRVLHCWLEQSGNIEIWKLLAYLLSSAMEFEMNSAQQQQQQDDKMKLVQPGTLPPAIKELYPQGLHRAAEVVLRHIHTTKSQDSGVHRPEMCIDDVAAALSLINTAVEGGGVELIDAWRLALDGIAQLKFVLKDVPWSALEEAIESDALQSQLPSLKGGIVPCPPPPAAAAWLGLVMWPCSAGRQHILREIIALKWNAIDLREVLPWMEALLRWRQAYG